MDITPSTLRALYVGLSTAFNARLESTSTLYKTIAMTVTSTTAGNEYPRMDDLPGMREWIGDRIIHDLSAQTYYIRNREFENTIGIKRSMIKDDQIGLLAPMAAQLGQDAAEFPDQLVFPAFKNGDKVRCYDGQYFFDREHPGYDEQGKETAVSNLTPGTGPAWFLIDDTKVIKPMIFQDREKFKLIRKDQDTDDNAFNKSQYVYGVDGRCNAGFGLWQLAHMSKAPLTPQNYEAARQAMGSIRKRNGQVISINPTKLLVPSVLEGAARQVVEAQLVNGGDSNIWFKTAEVVKVPALG